MSKIITIVGNEVVVTSTNGVETQVQKIQLKNNYYTQLKGTNVSILNNEHHVVYVIPAADFSPASTASQIQALLTGIINADTEAVVSSATWGFDMASILFYVKQKSDGSVVYESPIGTVAVPTGAVTQYSPISTLTNLNVVETNAAGAIPPCLAWTLVNSGGAPLILNGVSTAACAQPFGHEGKTINGTYFYAPTFTYDATGTQITITYQSL